MKIPDQCVELIKRWEGFRAEPYLCSAGYWTIGYGHVIRAPNGRMLNSKDPAPQMCWTDFEALTMLVDRDLPVYRLAVDRLCGTALTDGQLSALVSFAYNLGGGALRASTLRKKVLAGDHEEAARQFGRWVFAGGQKLRGLVLRRADEAAIYLQ